MVKRVIKALDAHTEEYMMGALLVALTVVMLLQVVMRYVFNHALSWPEEFCCFDFIFFSFFTLGYCVKNDTMLKLDFFQNLFPGKAKEVVKVILQLITLAFFGYMLIAAYDLVADAKARAFTSPAMGIPFYYIYLSAVIGFALGVIRSVQYIYILIRSMSNKNAQKETR